MSYRLQFDCNWCYGGNVGGGTQLHFLNVRDNCHFEFTKLSTLMCGIEIGLLVVQWGGPNPGMAFSNHPVSLSDDNKDGRLF